MLPQFEDRIESESSSVSELIEKGESIQAPLLPMVSGCSLSSTDY
jgi:hypothetical protein